MLNYFDLNKRAERGQQKLFQLFYKKGGVPTTPPTPAEPGLTVLDQITMYAGTAVGVLFSSAVSQFKNGTFGGFSFTLPTLILSAVIALLIMPIVYEKINIKPSVPFIVRLGLFVQHGVFWHVLFDAVGKVIGS